MKNIDLRFFRPLLSLPVTIAVAHTGDSFKAALIYLSFLT